MENPKKDRSVIDSLAFLNKFLTDRYLEELQSHSKNGKKKNKKDKGDTSLQNESQKKITNAEITTDIIYDLNANKKSPPQIKSKEFNVKTKKLQKKKKQSTTYSLDYQPIPFNFLSTKYNNARSQFDGYQVSDIQAKTQNNINELKENYDLVMYLRNTKIKSDAFTKWSKKFYYSVLRNISVKNNHFHFEKNPIILSQTDQKQIYDKKSNLKIDFQKNRTQKCNLYFLSSSLQVTNDQNKLSNSLKNNDHLKGSKESASDDERDRYVDIVLSEDSLNVYS